MGLVSYIRWYYKDGEIIEGELKSQLALSNRKNNPNIYSHCKTPTDTFVLDGQKRCSICLTSKSKALHTDGEFDLSASFLLPVLKLSTIKSYFIRLSLNQILSRLTPI